MPPQATTAGEPWDRRRCHARPNSRSISIAWTRQVTVTNLICGVDVARGALEARLEPRRAVKASNASAAGIAGLAAFCKEHPVDLVAMEATGGYERLALWPAVGAGVPAGHRQPAGGRRFAEAMGILEKTDRIDAGVIAWFAEVKHIAPQPPASDRPAAAHRAGHPVAPTHRVDRTANSTSSRLVTDPEVRHSFDQLLQLLRKRKSAASEGRSPSMIDSDPLWQPLDAGFRDHQRCGRSNRRLLLRRAARNRHPVEQSRRQARRPRPNRPRQRQLNGKRPVRGGTQRHPLDPLCRRGHRRPLRSQPRRVPTTGCSKPAKKKWWFALPWHASSSSNSTQKLARREPNIATAT